jgi:mercuric ion transport protein
MPSGPPTPRTERGVAAVGTLAGFSALFSAAACCILPFALAGAGLGAGSFAPFVPYRWPLTGFALVMIAAGWLFYFKRRRSAAASSRATLIMLCLASLVTLASAGWGLIEQPLLRALGG